MFARNVGGGDEAKDEGEGQEVTAVTPDLVDGLALGYTRPKFCPFPRCSHEDHHLTSRVCSA